MLNIKCKVWKYIAIQFYVKQHPHTKSAFLKRTPCFTWLHCNLSCTADGFVLNPMANFEGWFIRLKAIEANFERV